jgi:hypothetical protein
VVDTAGWTPFLGSFAVDGTAAEASFWIYLSRAKRASSPKHTLHRVCVTCQHILFSFCVYHQLLFLEPFSSCRSRQLLTSLALVPNSPLPPGSITRFCPLELVFERACYFKQTLLLVLVKLSCRTSKLFSFEILLHSPTDRGTRLATVVASPREGCANNVNSGLPRGRFAERRW